MRSPTACLSVHAISDCVYLFVRSLFSVHAISGSATPQVGSAGEQYDLEIAAMLKGIMVEQGKLEPFSIEKQLIDWKPPECKDIDIEIGKVWSMARERANMWLATKSTANEISVGALLGLILDDIVCVSYCVLDFCVFLRCYCTTRCY